MHKKVYTGILLLCVLQTIQAEELNCKSDYPKVISPDLELLGQQLKNNDYSFMQQRTHTSLINFVGGKEKYLALLKSAQNMITTANIEIQNVESNPPLYSYIVDQEEICFVPKSITMKLNNNVITTPPSFMVAIRSLGSHQWTYLDGSGLQKNPQMFYILFPNFPKNLEVPFKIDAGQ